MKKYATILVSALALFACTPNLEPENPQPEDGSEQPSTIAVQRLELSQTALSLPLGEATTLTARITPDNATDKTLTWASSDPDVATVSQSGEVVAVAIGNCTVSVSCGGQKSDCAVTVVPVPVESVHLDVTDADLLVGETIQLKATILPTHATEQEIAWTSSNTDIAVVENGLVTALAAGDATITATVGSCSAACLVRVTVPFTYGGMCMESITAGKITISNPFHLTIDYKQEDREWRSANTENIMIEVDAGERVWFRGRNESYAAKEGNSITATAFRCNSGEFYLYGNLMSLIYGDEYEAKTEMTGEYAFSMLFGWNNRIFNHPEYDIVLPATTLSASCYRSMFHACSGLTRAPKLPAKVLKEACYSSMFAYCTSLKEFPEMAATDMAYMSCTWMMMGSGIEEAPELPAMNLARSCYEFMFMECPNLKKAMSVLPATELAPNCYTGMFQRAEKLENAPKLPASQLKYSCYSHMFNGCVSLKKGPELPATELAEACYQRMFGNSGLVEAPELPAVDLDIMCYEYMFEGCKGLEEAPVLPALNLKYWCYEKMFKDCTSLRFIKMLATKAITSNGSGDKLIDLTANNIGSYCTEWVVGVASEGIFVKNSEATWNLIGPDGVPEGWIVTNP